jgi:NAD(P)-dependent dehydrogenase (short-subunit alcohol dehydrogenase family)
VEEIGKEGVKIDILVNNAGVCRINDGIDLP